MNNAFAPTGRNYQHPSTTGRCPGLCANLAPSGRLIRHYTDRQIRNKNLSSVNLSNCQGGIFLLHRHLLVIAQIDALWQTGEVGAYVLAVERVDLIGCWVIGVG